MCRALNNTVTPMELLIYSDLLLEFTLFDPASTDADVVILAGDIDIKSRDGSVACTSIESEKFTWLL
jgi:hypothetical protein